VFWKRLARLVARPPLEESQRRNKKRTRETGTSANTPREAIKAPYHHDIKLWALGICHELIER